MTRAYSGSADFLDRFWNRVEIGAADECWPWTGPCAHGYGIIGLGARPIGAHRVAFILSTGVDLGTKTQACHRCDNPPCCNPTHLFAGTHGDNIRDMVAKGRHAMSKRTHCRHGHALTADNVVEEGDGARRCLTCRREQKERSYRRYEERHPNRFRQQLEQHHGPTFRALAGLALHGMSVSAGEER